jgi:hypothetical protein
VKRRRLEDRISELCDKAVRTHDLAELQIVVWELRQALSQQISRLQQIATAKLAAGLDYRDRRSHAEDWQRLEPLDGLNLPNHTTATYVPRGSNRAGGPRPVNSDEIKATLIC